MKNYLHIFAFNVLLLAVLFCVAEILLLAVVKSSLLIYMPRAARVSLYNESRNIIQFLPECAEYDPELTYVLKKTSEFDFENVEFRTHYRTNSLGLRDEEKSLQKPKIVILGDSVAMGWGVEQGETYAKILESNSGLPTLNAGVSSYGTVREMKMLNRVDTGNLKYLIVQYSENDLEENYRYRYLHATPMTQEWYRKYQQKAGYHFGKYTYVLARFLKNNLFFVAEKHNGQKDVESDPLRETGWNLSDAKTREVELFLYYLLNNEKLDYKNTIIIVFELSDPDRYKEDFMKSLRERVASRQYGEYQNIRILDMMSTLDRRDFFVMDDHINKSGHMKVANALMKEIQRANSIE